MPHFGGEPPQPRRPPARSARGRRARSRARGARPRARSATPTPRPQPDAETPSNQLQPAAAIPSLNPVIGVTVCGARARGRARDRGASRCARLRARAIGERAAARGAPRSGTQRRRARAHTPFSSHHKENHDKIRNILDPMRGLTPNCVAAGTTAAAFFYFSPTGLAVARVRAALACAARRRRWWQVEAAPVAGRATRAPSAPATTNGAAKAEHRDCVNTWREKYSRSRSRQRLGA